MLPFAFKAVGVGSTINLNGKRRGKRAGGHEALEIGNASHA